MDKKKKLTPKQEKFARLCVCYGDGSKAYREAYNAEGMKGSTINTKAWELRKREDIKSRIRELDQDCAELIGLSKGKIARRLMGIAFADLPGIIKYDRVGGLALMRLETFEKLTKDQRSAIKKVKAQTRWENEDGDQVQCVEIELKDDLAALDKLNKMFSYYEPKKIEHSGTVAVEAPTLVFKDTTNGGK